MALSYRDATINSVEANPTGSGSTGGGRDENGKVYFFPNISVSIGYWFDNEGIPNSDWNRSYAVRSRKKLERILWLADILRDG